VTSPFHRLRELTRTQLFRYLLVGGWNTLFGYLVFAGLTYLLTGLVPYAYMVAYVLSNVIAITAAYLGYKFLVFRTRGNYLSEYLRFYVVYGASALLGLVMLPILVKLVGLVLSRPSHAPYVAQALVIPLTVLASFVGHRGYSFRQRGPSPAGARSAGGRRGDRSSLASSR
jgi:putative flippase GtrA